MDIGLDLLANPNKIKKKTYISYKTKDDFNLQEFILDTIKDELSIDENKLNDFLLKQIINMSLKISDEYKTLDISHLKNLETKDRKEKLPLVLTKNLKIKKIVEKKEIVVEVSKLPGTEVSKLPGTEVKKLPNIERVILN